MSFPSTLLPLVSDMYISNAWNDITSYVRREDGQGVTISSRGRRDESKQTSPATADFTVKNSTDFFSYLKPTATNYLLIGQNTQVRHRVRWLNDQFDRSVSSGIGTSTDGTVAWGTSGGSASDYNVTGGQAVLSLTSVGVSRIVGGTPALPIHDVTIQVDTNASPATGASITARIAFSTSTTSINDAYICWVIFKTNGAVSLQIDKSIGGSSTTLVAATEVGFYTSGEVWTVRFKRFTGGYLAAYATSSTPTAMQQTGWTVYTTKADTSHSASTLTKLVFAARAETGNTSVSPTVSFESLELNSYRFYGEIPTWDPDADSTGLERYVRMQAADVLRRLSKGQKPLKSAVFRAMSGELDGDLIPVCYVPMEDSSNATSLASGIPNGPDAVFSGLREIDGVTLASETSAAGSAPLPTLSQYGRIAGSIPYFTLQETWFGQFMFKYDARPASNRTLGYVDTPGAGSSVARLQFVLDVTTFPGQSIIFMRAITSTGTIVGEVNGPLTGIVSFPTDDSFYGRYYSIVFGMFATSDVPGDYEIFLGMSDYLDSRITGVSTDSITGDMARPTKWIFGHNTADTWSIGHFGIFTSALADALSDIFYQASQHSQAVDGYQGEAAGRRLLRLGTQEGLNVHVIGDPDATQPCGPQRIASLSDNLFDAADADQGLLYGSADFLGIEYRTNESMLWQSGLDLDYSADHLSAFAATDTDKYTANKVTARRNSGSSATVEVTTGRKSTQPVPNGIGEYEEDLPWNIAYDSQTIALAGWRAHLGSWDELRIKKLEVLGHRYPIYNSATILAQLMMLSPGDYLGVANPRSDLPPDKMESLVQGWTETLANFEWKLAPELVNAGPYDVFQLDSATFGRLEGDHTLHENVTSTATAWKVRLGSGPLLITDDAEDGMQWMVRGELVTVTDVAPPTIAYRSSGTASSGSSGSRTPGLPTGAASGDLILIYASTRNSGTGIPDTPSNWTRLKAFESSSNAQVFGRIYDGVWSMPTVTFTGGAANEDTLAQSAALTGNFGNMAVDLRFASSLNASAQDILVPKLPRSDIPRNFMALYFGWKQDDWTSVATPGSWTEIAELSSTAGNDAAQVWGYRQFTSYPAVDALSPALVVTGGASAVSRGAVMVLRSTFQDVTVTRSVNGVVKAQTSPAPIYLHPAPHLAY